MDVSASGSALVGGASNSLVRLLKGLDDCYQASIFTSLPQGQQSLNLERLGIPDVSVFPLFIKRSSSSLAFGMEFLAKATWAMAKRRSQLKFDIVHGHSGHPHYVLASLMAGRIWSAPVVHTLYCPLKAAAQANGLPPNLALLRYFMPKVDKVIAITRNVANSLTRIGLLEEKVRIIPPAIDIDRFNPECSGDNVKRQIGAEGPIILFVGNLTKTKGLDILLRAMQPVLRGLPGARLVATLDLELKRSPYEERRKRDVLEQIERYGLAKHVTLMGVVENMPELMAAADLLVAPFLSTDGPSDYPLPLLESMAVGTPVIATPVGGIPEIIRDGKTGILVPPGDAEALAAAIVDLLGNRQMRTTLGRRASEFVSTRFSVESVARQVETVYEEVKRQH
jgi:glycosyltransferase involved in cell wall biosynthesis